MKKVKLIKRELVHVSVKAKALKPVYHKNHMYEIGDVFVYNGVFKNGETPDCLELLSEPKVLSKKTEIIKRTVFVADEMIVEGEELLQMKEANGLPEQEKPKSKAAKAAAEKAAKEAADNLV